MRANALVIGLAGVGFLVLACCGLGGLGAFTGYRGYQRAGANIENEVRPLVTKLLASMDSEEVTTHLSDERLKYEGPEVTKFYFDSYKVRFGRLTSLGPAKLTTLNVTTVDGRTTEEAILTYESSFAKADGDVTLEVVRVNGHPWKVTKLRVISAK